MRRWLPVLSTVLLLLTGCKKDNATPDQGLPPATTSGAETLGFQLNGDAWVPGGQRCGIYGCTDNKVEASAYPQGGRLHLLVSATRTGFQLDQAFTLTLDSLVGVGTYPLDTPQTQLTFADNRQGTTYQSSARLGGSVTITKIDTVAWIVSGTFRGRLANVDKPASTVEIQTGRFDVLYNR
ncbi:DUF6252 family protein [Hymenobacter guriensis]|uniref:Lipoprotein n=1 Tax=Hymenobacter guriensis TaxID=2793065 RepID=A0ABS0L5W3_9BACT|nr:DUF6252 family protein [Hymenobacter guriensis]MBG8555548.1 hypothetical protein [Hymenobacter guriensis]